MAENVVWSLDELSFSKGDLALIPPAELELILRVGLAVNELMFLRRVLNSILLSQPETDSAKDIWISHVVTALVSITGKVFESLEVFRRHFLSTPLGRDYRDAMTEESLEATEYLRRLGGTNSLLADIRNTFSFHFHNDRPLSPFLEHLNADNRMSLYFGICDANTLYHFALEPFITSLMHITKSQTADDAIVKVIAIIDPATNAFNVFARWITEKVVFDKVRLTRAAHQLREKDTGMLEQQRFPAVMIPEKPAR